jgi:glycosyltransferase involved in cell wall biosynthesis
MRKGFGDVIRAFQEAFPLERDVRLGVKGFPDCDIPGVNDDRISVIRQYFSPRRLGEWFRSLTCFVSASRAEGWGLMQHEALATGRPVISVKYGGVKEFFDDEVGFPITHRLARASGHYAGCGSWAEPVQRSLVRQMRRVYEDRAGAAARGKRGSLRAVAFTWQRFQRELLTVLHHAGMIP